MAARRAARGQGGRGRDSYHHGMLREALLRATDEILEERGTEGFTLREAARRAGVSPAAPAHHFGSAAGLLTEVAIAGFEELTQALREAASGEASAAARVRAQGLSYVRYALAHPGRFQLMFRRQLLLQQDERLDAAGEASLAELESTVRQYLGADASRRRPRPDERAVRAMVLGAWSVVHGFAHLALDGKLAAVAEHRGVADFTAEVLPDLLMALLPDRPAALDRSSGS